MTSKIGVKKIIYPNGTDAITIGTSGDVAIASDYFGPPNWDSAGTRPSVDSSNYGSLGYNIQKGGLEFWDVKNQQWTSIGITDGLDPSTAFANTDQISDLGYTGYRDLYTTFGGNTAPVLVKVDFETTGGPYIVVSFKFGTGGYNDYNDTLFVHGEATNNNPYTNTRGDDEGDLGLGDGTEPLDSIYGSAIANDKNLSGTGAVIVSSAVSSEYTIGYYNHATQAEFTSAQISAMQDWVSELCSETPHVACEADSQGNTSSDAYNDQGGPDSDLGHQLWIKDKDGVWLRATPKDNTTDESASCYIWTHNTYAEKLFGSGGAFASMNTGLGASSGLTSVASSKIILPAKIAVTSGTGGGTLFGTPANGSHTRADGGSGNTLNSRAFFLIK